VSLLLLTSNSAAPAPLRETFLANDLLQHRRGSAPGGQDFPRNRQVVIRETFGRADVSRSGDGHNGETGHRRLQLAINNTSIDLLETNGFKGCQSAGIVFGNVSFRQRDLLLPHATYDFNE